MLLEFMLPWWGWLTVGFATGCAFGFVGSLFWYFNI